MIKMIRCLTALIAVTMLPACQPQKPTGQQAQSTIKADDIVTLSKSAFGCESEMDFMNAIKHYGNKEYAAWADDVADKIRCFHGGGSDKKTWEWTVFQVQGDVAQVGFMTAAQVDQDGDRYSHKYWTMTKWVVPTGRDIYEGMKPDAESKK